jgi:hypothetical protein
VLSVSLAYFNGSKVWPHQRALNLRACKYLFF